MRRKHWLAVFTALTASVIAAWASREEIRWWYLDWLNREEKVLARYRQEYQAKPDGPNYRPTERLIVTLKHGVPVVRLFQWLDGHRSTQQWCLMPLEDNKVRVALDTTTGGSLSFSLDALISEALENIEPVRESAYLDRVLKRCEWREAANHAPFGLLFDHVTEGRSADYVKHLLGKPDRVEAGSWHYRFGLFHCRYLAVIKFQGDRVLTCEAQGGVHVPLTTNQYDNFYSNE